MNMRKIGVLICLSLACSQAIWGQRSVPAQIIVTTGHFYGEQPPLLTTNELIVTQNNAPRTITSVIPLRGDRAGLELFLLVDNCSSCEVGPKFDELRKFIATQPSTTSVGVAYIQDGQLQVAENPTPDRERAIKALSAPGGSKTSSPYNALTDLIKGWRQDSARHAVLMISTGLDPAAPDPGLSRSKSAEAAIEAAQRAEVTVYAIYHPSADYLTSDPSRVYAGQIEMSHVAYETGGEAYFVSFTPLPSLAPFLSDISQHLANQYLLEFLANPGSSPRELQEVEVTSKVPDLDLMAPYKVVIPGNSVTDEKTKVAPRRP
jgi:hypothetical protein